MTDRTPTALDDAWEALRGDLMDGLPSEPLVHVPAVIVLHRPRIEAATKDRAEPRAEGLHVERLAIAYQRAQLWCEDVYPGGWSQTGDLVPAIAREYAALEEPGT
jgi:hypothetical protein